MKSGKSVVFRVLTLLLNPKLPFGYIILRVSAGYARWFCVSRKGGTGGGGWVHPQGGMHMVAAGLGCESAMVGTVWANSCPGCMSGFQNATLTL